MMKDDYFKFEIPLCPAGQRRARAAVRGQHAMIYKSKEQIKAEAKLETYLVNNRPDKIPDAPVWLGVKAYLPLPKSKPKWWKKCALRGEIYPETKPDLDNILKHLKDCMNGIFWIDDKQVVGYLEGTGKYYEYTEDGTGHYEIEVIYGCRIRPNT